jgi:hypothetical protein
MKENPLAPPKPPNLELLEHEKKHKIESQVFSYRKKLSAEEPNLTQDEVSSKVKDYRIQL